MVNKTVRIDSAWVTSFVLIQHILDRKLMEQLGLSITAYRILCILRDSSSMFCISEIARKLGIALSTASRAVDALVAEFLCENGTQDASGDGRKSLVGITSRGTAKANSADTAMKTTIANIWRPILVAEGAKDLLDRVISGSAFSVRRNGVVLADNARLRGEATYVFAICNRVISFTESVAVFGLTLPEYRILLLLSEEADPIPLRDLAADLFMWSNDASLRCKGLFQRGLVSRHPLPAKRHGLCYGLTDNGYRAVQDATRHMEAELSSQPWTSDGFLNLAGCADSIVRHLRQFGDMNNILRQI